MVLVSLKAYCAINDTYENLIDISNFESFEMVPDLNRNHDSVKEYSKNLSSYFCTQDLYRPKFETNDPIFAGHNIYYKDNSKDLTSHIKNFYKIKKHIQLVTIAISTGIFAGIFVGSSILLAAWW